MSETNSRGTGAYAQCSCRRYSDDPRTLRDNPPTCDCGRKYGWSGSFMPPTEEDIWSDHNRHNSMICVKPDTRDDQGGKQ